MKRRFLYGFILMLATPGLLLAGVTFSDLSLRIPTKTDYYLLYNTQESSNPGFLKFQIKADHASYEVEGVLPLIKLLREIEVIEKIRRNEETSGFFEGVSASVEATADGFVNLVTHTIQSGKGIGKAAGKVGRSIGGLFRSKEEGEKSGFGESVLGSAERELAKQFNVDVYTSNPYLREVLTRMARARVGGKSFVFLATFLIPVGAISLAVSASGLNGAADQIVNDNSRQELFRLNKEALLDMKIMGYDAEGLLNSTRFSPREATYLRTYLEQLRKVAGFREILKIAGQVNTELDAHKILYSTQIAAEEIKKRPRSFDRIEVWGDGLKASSAGSLIFIMPYDLLQADSHGKGLLKKMKDEQAKSGKPRVELWTAGAAAPEFTRAIKMAGMDFRKSILWGGRVSEKSGS